MKDLYGSLIIYIVIRRIINEGCSDFPTPPGSNCERNSLGGDADSDSFQGLKQSSNRSNVLLVLGKAACRS